MKLLDTLNEKYPDWLGWEPETIRDIIDPTEKEFNKIMALQTAYNSQYDEDGFHFTDWFIFEKIVSALNNVEPDFSELEHPEVVEIHKALAMLPEEVSFEEEVLKYIAASYKAENIVYCPFIEGVNQFLEDDDLSRRVKREWPKKSLQLKETPVNVQLRRLLMIRKVVDQYG